MDKIKKNPLSAHCDRASVCNNGQMALRSNRYGPLYFSSETGIVKRKYYRSRTSGEPFSINTSVQGHRQCFLLYRQYYIHTGNDMFG